MAQRLRDPSEVTEDDRHNLFRFLSASPRPHRYFLSFRADAPIDLRVALFVPSIPPPPYAIQSAASGVNVYSRGVLISPHSADVLPPFLWFLVGAVDSADFPLNVSRETLQVGGGEGV
jgi:HSP90 family molecular chaperone